MTRTSLRALLRRAARLLDDEAKVTRESCAGNGGALWVCDDCTRQPCAARKRHDRQVATAKELRDAAQKGVRG